MKKKNGNEKIRFTIDSQKENSSASILSKTFFWVIAANADKKADSKAIINQLIKKIRDL